MRVCKYCDLLVGELHLQCCQCEEYVHLKCCKRGGPPGGLAGDVFYIYTCEDCSPTGAETFERAKMTWVDVMILVLYNLTVKHAQSSSNGYFHRDRQIKKFLNNNWPTIFPHLRSRRRTWRQMLDVTLKKNPDYFKAGFDAEAKGPLWYKLAHPNMLPTQSRTDRQLLTARKTGRRKREEAPSETETSTGYDSSSQDGEQGTSMGPSIAETQLKIKSLNPDNDMYSRSYVKPSARLSEFLFAGEEETCGGAENSCVAMEEDVDIEDIDLKDAIDFTNQPEPPLHIRLPTQASCSAPHSSSESTMSVENPMSDIEDESSRESAPPPKKPTREKRLMTRNPNSRVLPWIPTAPPLPTKKCAPMNLGEEAYELSKLSKRIQTSESMSVAELRLHRKLAVRKQRRERGMSVFNIDEYSQDGGATAANTVHSRLSTASCRVLDRYQRQTLMSGTSGSEQTFWTRLMGHTEQYSCFTSPMTNRVLKAYIRRDYESKPLWLRLCGEIRAKGGLPKEPPSPIIYSYVRPHHIHAINSLAEQYFWPGINLSECLQYPDYSCVVLYKKLVVGFAFIVPDVDFNEAYISFIFTRPEWRRAGIASFMLYHLIQTCMGKDITLHVSATNPALLLYQKFGFKVEQFLQDFYDKYLPVESSDCRHALFLRLARS